MKLTAAGVCVEIDGTPIVSDLDLEVAPGAFVVLGPNGSGKSTLLRTVYRALRPVAGVISVGGDDVWKLAVREAARRTAAVLQERPERIQLTVFEVVATGRIPHKGRWIERRRRTSGSASARWSASRCCTPLRDPSTACPAASASACCSRALAQESKVLVPDEPTNHLDVRFTLELLDLVRQLRVTTLVAMHDLNLAARYCDRLVVLSAGRVVDAGTVDALLHRRQISGPDAATPRRAGSRGW